MPSKTLHFVITFQINLFVFLVGPLTMQTINQLATIQLETWRSEQCAAPASPKTNGSSKCVLVGRVSNKQTAFMHYLLTDNVSLDDATCCCRTVCLANGPNDAHIHFAPER